MPEVLNIFMRWLHIASAVALIGGFLHARLVMVPAAQALVSGGREALGEHAAARFRPILLLAISGLIISGLYNLVIMPGHTAKYHILLGIKLLLVLHIFTSGLYAVRPSSPRRSRLFAGAAISGLIVILIAAWLRRIY